MNGQERIRLLLADVDGTLVTGEKVLTEAAKAAARQLRDAGIALAITSSRPPRGMKMLIEPLALECVIAGFNGGMLVHPDLSAIEAHPFDPGIAGQAVQLLLGLELDVWLYTENEWFLRDANAPHVAYEVSTLQFDPMVVDRFTDAHIAHAMKIVGVSGDHGLAAACESVVQKALGGHASAERSQPYFLDVTSPKANKGKVVETLSKLLDIPAGEIATIGDMPNDVLMFRKSGFSIAMGNASGEVKAEASAVTDSNGNEGFAKAVQRFVLPRASR